MAHFAASAIGRDRPGIVASVSRVLLEHGVNIEDSQMTILRGHFAMTLVLEGEVDAAELRAGLERAGAELGLEAVSLSEVPELEAGAEPPASHVVSVYGVDHPGIVHAVSSLLAERDVNITDLTTRLVGDEQPQRLYAMLLEVAIPEGVDAGELGRLLAEVAEREAVDITLRPLEQDAL